MPGPVFHKILFGIAQFVAPKFGMSEGRHFYEKNRKIEASLPFDIITDQRKLAGMVYGDTDVGTAGCEAVAIYNILMLERRPRPLSDIIYDLQSSQTLVNRGKWGTNPFAMKTLLREYDFDFEEIGSVEEAASKMQPGDKLLVTVWNHSSNPFKGIHGYVVYMTGEKEYWILNKNYKSKPELSSGLEEAIGEGRYIVGYLIR